MRWAGATSAVMAMMLAVIAAAGCSAARDPASPSPPGEGSSPSPTPTVSPTPTASPTPTPAATPPASADELELLPPELVGPPGPGPVDPDEPVARVEGLLTVKDKSPKKSKKQKEEVAGEVKTPADKKWLAEVCPVGENEGTWLDRSQDRLGWSVCRATLWFDGLFGDERAVLERDATYGYLEPALEYNEEDGIDPKLRVRAKINLPVADRRFNALLGRSDDEDDDRQRSSSDSGEQLPSSFEDADEEWLVGLGYSPVRGSRRRLDFDGGVKLNTPIDLFGQGRFRKNWFLSQRDLVRLRQNVFWRTDDGFGTSVNLDFERLLRGPYVLRWRNGATLADNSRGVDWFDELTLFHRLGEKTALAYVLSVDGATDEDVPVTSWTLETIYRRNILREWLFVELRPGLEYRRRELELDRELDPIFGVGLQIHFGDREFE